MSREVANLDDARPFQGSGYGELVVVEASLISLFTGSQELVWISVATSEFKGFFSVASLI